MKKSNAGQPPFFKDPESLETAILKYFDTEEKYTITGLALALGFESRQSIYDYKERPQFSYIIKRACLMVENGYEKALHGNNVAGAVFALKNMGWADNLKTENSNEHKVEIKPPIKWIKPNGATE
jgi:hypothetical protein